MRKSQLLTIGLLTFAFGSAQADRLLIDFDGDSFFADTGLYGSYGCTGGECATDVNSEGYGLGNFIARGGNGEFTFTIAGGIGSHSMITLSFDLAIIDSWDGDTTSGGLAPGPDLFMVADGGTLFSETFDNFDLNDDSFADAPIVGPTHLGFNPTWEDSLYHIDLTFAHTADSLSLTWSASGLQALFDESWAIDNLTITSVPEPGTLALLGIGLFGMGLAARRKRA